MGKVELVPMTQSEENFEFVYGLKRDAFGPHIAAKWGWDEKLQRATLVERLNAKSYFRILLDGVAVGTVAIDEKPDHVRVDEFYISPSCQNQGIGSSVVKRIVDNAKAKRLPVRAECLKWSPALSFYKRHGFLVTSEGDTHLSLERVARHDDG